MPGTYAIVPAAGRGLRMGRERPKQFLELCGKPIVLHTLDALAGSGLLSGIFLVVPADFFEKAKALIPSLDGGLPIEVVRGGPERQHSVSNALMRLPADCQWVVIHDGVRPFVSVELISKTMDAAVEAGAAIAALPATDTVKRVAAGAVVETIPREEVWLVQTPQVFRKDIILSAYRAASENSCLGTDDASLVERIGIAVSVVPGESRNIKVTTPEDLAWSEWLISNRHAQRPGLMDY